MPVGAKHLYNGIGSSTELDLNVINGPLGTCLVPVPVSQPIFPSANIGTMPFFSAGAIILMKTSGSYGYHPKHTFARDIPMIFHLQWLYTHSCPSCPISDEPTQTVFIR